jgi:hypothetical protein
MVIRKDYVCEGRGADGTLLPSLARPGEGMCVCVWGGEGGRGENTAEWSIVPQKAGSGQAAPLLPALHIHQPARSLHRPACQFLT